MARDTFDHKCYIQYENTFLISTLLNHQYLDRHIESAILDFQHCHRIFIYYAKKHRKIEFNKGSGIFITDNLEKTRYFPSSPNAILNQPLIRS